jgi:hypothetical protein
LTGTRVLCRGVTHFIPKILFVSADIAQPLPKILFIVSADVIQPIPITFCQCVHGVRVPTSFSSNISKLVSMNDLSMYGYNSHDCHVMMMVFLAIAIRAIKPVHVKLIITRLCYFFNTVSQKVIGRKELDDLRAYMIETMCMLEMCFPPFFYMRQHLMIYLVDQIHTLGPLYLHSMFPYERYLSEKFYR